MKNVLIAHQSTIPHYRVEFYNLLKRELGESIKIDVVLDENSERRKLFFKEDLDFSKISFNLRYCKTFFISKVKKICFQTFFFHCWKYDLIILENAVNNFAYPLSIFYKILGVKVAFWGHGRDLNNPNNKSLFKSISEWFKLYLIKFSDGFFAYTDSVKDYLESQKINTKKIFVINNTINLQNAREAYLKFPKDNKLTKKLVFTGRISKSKRIDFLISSFKHLIKLDPEFELHIIGEPDNDYNFEKLSIPKSVHFHGAITDNLELAKIYQQMDLYVYPGYVGLGALHAMCFDLIPVVIDSDWHKPEIDYLSNKNSIKFKKDTDEENYANHIHDLYMNNEQIILRRDKIWDSIKFLTVDTMAKNFKKGIKSILGVK